MRSKKESNNLEDVMQSLTSQYLGTLTERMFAPSPFFGMEKPQKFWYEPIFTFKIPYPIIRYEYSDYDEPSDSSKGLFINWHTVNIGKRKVINENYKEEYKKWKEHTSKPIVFKRYSKSL